MASRRLDISSLLCDDDKEQSLPVFVPEPVILAPHLRLRGDAHAPPPSARRSTYTDPYSTPRHVATDVSGRPLSSSSLNRSPYGYPQSPVVSPTSPSPFYSQQQPSSSHRPPSSQPRHVSHLHSPLTHHPKPAYHGLDALVHAATEEAMRLDHPHRPRPLPPPDPPYHRHLDPDPIQLSPVSHRPPPSPYSRSRYEEDRSQDRFHQIQQQLRQRDHHHQLLHQEQFLHQQRAQDHQRAQELLMDRERANLAANATAAAVAAAQAQAQAHAQQQGQPSLHRNIELPPPSQPRAVFHPAARKSDPGRPTLVPSPPQPLSQSILHSLDDPRPPKRRRYSASPARPLNDDDNVIPTELLPREHMPREREHTPRERDHALRDHQKDHFGKDLIAKEHIAREREKMVVGEIGYGRVESPVLAGPRRPPSGAAAGGGRKAMSVADLVDKGAGGVPAIIVPPREVREREAIREREAVREREAARERDKEREARERDKEREARERDREREARERDKERETRERDKERETRERDKEREARERDKDREAARERDRERDKEREARERDKERETREAVRVKSPPHGKRSPPGSQIGRAKAARRPDEPMVVDKRELLPVLVAPTPTAAFPPPRVISLPPAPIEHDRPIAVKKIKEETNPPPSHILSDLPLEPTPKPIPPPVLLPSVDPPKPLSALKAQEEDAHEWFLEHYADNPTPAVSPRSNPPVSPTPSASPLTSTIIVPSKSTATRPSRSPPPKKVTPAPPTTMPDAVDTLEQELEELISEAPPAHKNEPDAEMDLVDLAVTELVEETLGAEDDSKQGVVGMEVDVEDELLSLVDDTPRRAGSGSGTGAPKPAPLRVDEPVPRHAEPHGVAVLSAASPSGLLSPAVRPSSARTVSERGSMPPPATVGVRGKEKDEQSKKGESMPKKKKEVVSKSNAKPKPTPAPPAKPRAKAATKSKKANTAESPVTSKAPKPPVGKKHPSASRSRSASVRPEGEKQETAVGDEEEEDDAMNEDDKLYCVCKTKYDEDRFMIACDRCDEWYHTQCVDMPDLEVDLVDQFVCPPCIAKNPHLSLRTTYKTRCLYGLKHTDPDSPKACHRPARGAFSKYCSEECGVKYMQSRIDTWAKRGGKKDKLWNAVRGAEKREGVVVYVDEGVHPEGCDMNVDGQNVDGKNVDGQNVDGKNVDGKNVDGKNVDGKNADGKNVDGKNADGKNATNAEGKGKPKKPRAEREIERLRGQLDHVVKMREEIKKGMEVLVWRERVLELASERAGSVPQCGWDQRLCFSDEEWVDFGQSVLDSYEKAEGLKDEGAGGGEMGEGEPEPEEGDGEWWCPGKKVCDRHSGWQNIRNKEISQEKEKKEEALLKLTTRERELRKLIEDIVDPQGRTTNDSSSQLPLKSSNSKLANGHPKSKLAGDSMKKGKKRKAPPL